MTRSDWSRKKEPKTPYTFIQWKGTDVCADIYCECGWQYHYDGYFMYAVKCPNCEQEYELPIYLKLVAGNTSGIEPILLVAEDEE